MSCKGWNGWECFLSWTPMQFPICIPFTWGPMPVFTLTLLSISECVRLAEEPKILCGLYPSRKKYAYLYSKFTKTRSVLCAQSCFHLELTSTTVTVSKPYNSSLKSHQSIICLPRSYGNVMTTLWEYRSSVNVFNCHYSKGNLRKFQVNL